MILSLFATLSQEERTETVQSLVALLGGASSSGGAPAKKAAKGSAKASAAAPPKEKVSRGPSAWTQYVMRVRAETGLKMAEAMAEAKRRRESGDPDAPPAASAKKASPASAKAAPKPKKVTPPQAEEAEEESVSAELEEVEVEGQDYLYLPAAENAAWLKEADGSRGAWAGYLDTETGEFDLSRPAPEFEEADD
jgi:hypothetical protein